MRPRQPRDGEALKHDEFKAEVVAYLRRRIADKVAAGAWDEAGELLGWAKAADEGNARAIEAGRKFMQEFPEAPALHATDALVSVRQRLVEGVTACDLYPDTPVGALVFRAIEDLRLVLRGEALVVSESRSQELADRDAREVQP